MAETTYTYILPGENNTLCSCNTETNSLIIIGANGSGKSKLGAWIEQQKPEDTHRIGAQRSLIFGNYIQQKSYEQSTNLLLYGTEKGSPGNSQRWGWDGEKYNYTSSMIDDYEYVLSALVALKTSQQEEYINECRQLEESGQPHRSVPEMVIDVLQRIWKSVFPHRNIDIIDGKVVASLFKEGKNREYKGRDMSDGERVALYLIAQALCIPKDKTIIIDEPELHLHRSIMNRLWNAIESERQDCFFIYITHDTHFAANHGQTEKIWMKKFDGEHWDLETVQNSNLPEQLLLDILGNRKPVLFVEGTAESYDTKLYTKIYNDYYVIPCGSCSAVISRTKAMQANNQLHDLQCFGIIDRDYRTDYEIEAYKNDNIYTLKVAEVENLFLVREILEIVNRIMGFSDDKKIKNVTEYVIETRFRKEINRQICESVVAELKYKLTTASISNKNEEEAKETLENLYSEISYASLKKEHESKYNDALDSRDYRVILSVFNSKSLSSTTGHYFDLTNKAYCDFIIRQFETEKKNEIIDALSSYLPEEIPR